MKPITTVPNDVLTTPAKPVTFFDKRLQKMIAEMTATLKSTIDPKGVGLAATQISEPYRLFITKPNGKAKVRVFCNPEIIKFEESKTPQKDDGKLEGCLSIPHIWGKVKRYPEVTLRFQDEKGITHEEIFTGLMAIIVQHETDHVNGILFSHRIVEQQEKFYTISQDEHGKDVLEEVTL